ncbi:MAG: GntG family PLP-dependent aldolase [bacterium]
MAWICKMKAQIIDLRSDTVTRPTPGMLEAMLSARVGDDVFGDDPTVIELERKAASIFGKDAGLFCPSGTMTNQIAINVHTKPGDEVICDAGSHVYNYEGGGIAFNSGASVRVIQGNRGRITAGQVEQNVNPDDVHFPVSRLVVAENTSNRGGGSCYEFAELEKISQVCKRQELKYHLDGARFFNAMIATGIDPQKTGSLFDSVSICLSKGLGAPVGSVLLGDTSFIRYSRRIRKVFGGGMRQAGYLAAAGIYALDNHIERLREDHERAKTLRNLLEPLPFVSGINPVDTNIVVFTLTDKIDPVGFLDRLKKFGILAVGFGPQTIRMVTHLDFTDEMLGILADKLKKF